MNEDIKRLVEAIVRDLESDGQFIAAQSVRDTVAALRASLTTKETDHG